MRFVNANWPKGKFLTILFSIGLLSMVLSMVAAQRGATVTVFEGARLITGDGSAPIMDSAFVVDNGRFTAVGRKGQISVPAGATRVDLTGKTVIPAIIDAHKHLAVTRDALVDQLQHFAYYGVGVAMSMGQDRSEEHTSELQSLRHLVCRLLLEKKKKIRHTKTRHKDTQNRKQHT